MFYFTVIHYNLILTLKVIFSRIWGNLYGIQNFLGKTQWNKIGFDSKWASIQ